jgi:hypothetical protein
METTKEERLEEYPYYLKDREYVINGFLNQTYYFRNRREVDSWMQGAFNSLYAFCYMKKGVRYVGTTGKTLVEALNSLKDQYRDLFGEEFHLG